MGHVFVSGLLSKLAGFTVDKVLKLCGVDKAIEKAEFMLDITEQVKKLKKEVEKLMDELSWIKAFLEDADKRCIVGETHNKWVMGLVEIAYDIEDAVEIFLLECPTAQGIKGLSKKISKLPFFCNFQKDMENIREKISRVRENKEKYDPKNLGSSEHNTQSDSELKFDPVEDPEAIGLGEEIKNVVKNLFDDTNEGLAVVSIVGPGGIGKTTLAQKVYFSEDVRGKFEKLVWVIISEKYDLLDVFRRIAESLDIKLDGLNENKLRMKIREHLEKIKYLIVLDDVWKKELFPKNLKHIFPDKKNGSRILITTRFEDVARYADTSYEPYQLEFLKDKDSLDLFLKNAIPKSKQCSEGSILGLKDLPKKFVKKCKGLPLALIVLGSLLSTKPCNYHAWKEFLKTMKWQDDGIECNEVVATSFEHLPFARKFCFMYFAAFPEDHEIEAQSLLRMWIAEGLIPHEEGRTLEQTAKRFLEDLAQRSMVQVSKRYPDGSIKYLRVHDILRDLAIQKAEENKFLVVCSKVAVWQSPHNRATRRVAIHCSYIESNRYFSESMQQHASPNLRSLLIFGHIRLDCSKYRLLRVLSYMKDISLYRGIAELRLQGYKGSPYLRYLKLDRGDELSFSPLKSRNKEHFEEWIKSMKFLETLDLRLESSGLSPWISSALGGLSPWIWQIETLRHVLLPDQNDKFNAASLQKTYGPPSSANLTNLQTLRGVRCSTTWDTSSLPNIPNVREFCIEVDDSFDHVVVALLGKLNNLVSLFMRGKQIQLQHFEGVFPLLENLKHMNIHTSFNESLVELKDNMLPPNLLELYLKGFGFMSDPMPVLEKLDSLKILKIRDSKYPHPLKMKCSAGRFRQLEDLTLSNMEMLLEWNIELGAMPILKYLTVVECKDLFVPQPKWFINHKSLRYLNWCMCGKPEVDKANNEKFNEISIACPNICLVTYTTTTESSIESVLLKSQLRLTAELQRKTL